MVEAGLLVPKHHDEARQLRYLQAHKLSSAKELHLIIFPTEKCNFRCVYCYETFEKGRMTSQVRAAVKLFAVSQMASLEHLAIDWFGGEPLIAFPVIEDISTELCLAAKRYGCKLSGHITTNAFLLSPDISNKLLGWGVESFQVTLDGSREEHDKRRKMYRSNAGTFDRILDNVRSLLKQRRLFNLCLRTNYDLDSLPTMEAWIDELKEMVGGDPRVRVDFCPIWADPGRIDVSVPMGHEKQKTYSELLALAHSRGLRTNAPDYLSLGGLVCYAGKANSLAIRSNGDVNKCTVALEADYNRVGKLSPEGVLELDIDKFSKWTSSGLDQDPVCQKCPVSPTCQGNACPLERFENNRRPCPPVKNFPTTLLRLAGNPN